MYFARFEEISGRLYRFDTRIYLQGYCATQESICVGAIIGKNPGSAQPLQLGVWAPLELAGDKMLPSVRNRFVAAYGEAGKSIPRNAFVQVWNLFYLCNPKLREACITIRMLPSHPLCSSEESTAGVVWYAWGGDDPRLNAFKKRFGSEQDKAFYYEPHLRSIVTRKPKSSDFAKHPQGMPAEPVVEHMARLL